jgi:hypothetical protein
MKEITVLTVGKDDLELAKIPPALIDKIEENPEIFAFELEQAISENVDLIECIKQAVERI